MNLAVTATDLRVGQGYVRCGRCDRVFNALLSLSEDDDAEQSGHAATGTTSVPALQEMPPETVEADIEAVEQLAPQIDPVSESGDWEYITPILPDPPSDPALEVVESQATGTFETIVLEGDGYLQTEEHVDEAELEAQLAQIARQIDAESHNTSPETEASDTAVAATPPADEPELDADAAVGNPPPRHRGWTLAAIGLLLALVTQVVHHQRQSLVAQPLLQAPLQKLYGLFGVTLEPAWDLAAYDLRQLGGESMPGAGSSIILRATVHNRSPHRQPPPLIRVVLQDRFLNALSTTAIAPADYLRGAPPERMAPDQRLDAELHLEDPNQLAVGFELDVCLPGPGDTLHCSNGP